MQLKGIKSKLFLVTLLVGFVTVLCSCEKYEDERLKDWDPDAENYFCNDPDAVNYNWGFPGVMNDSICIFPTDLFVGSWTMIDTVFNDTFVVMEVRNRIVQFELKSDDSLKHLMTLNGFCDNETSFIFQANRHMLASVIDLLDGDMGQTACDGESILSGFIRTQDINADTLYVQMLQHKLEEEGTLTIKGIAFKN